jgi:hypothetical protein
MGSQAAQQVLPGICACPRQGLPRRTTASRAGSKGDRNTAAIGGRLASMNEDHQAIDHVIRELFAAFGNRGGVRPALATLRRILLPEAVIVKNVGPDMEVYGLEGFIAPRERILTDGTLADFDESEEEARTDIHGNVAQRLSLYRKSGVLAGQPFTTRGLKTIQLVRTPDGWRVSALAWDDAREGFEPPEHL